MKKSDQKLVGFRVPDEVNDKLREITYQENTTVQRLLEDALDAFLMAREKGASTTSAGDYRESVFLDEMKWFYRYADRETIRDVRSMVKVMRKGAEASGRVARELKVG